MKQIQFETSKVFGVFVKIDDFKEMKRAGMNLTGNFRIQYETTRDVVRTFTVDGIDENYKLQGFVSELTDEQKSMICKDADEFASLLTSLNVLLVNPLQDEWDEVCTWGHGSNITYAEYTEVANKVGNWILLTCNK